MIMKRSTIYFDPEIHKILKMKSLETSRSISDIVNDAVRLELAEDLEDINMVKQRKKEPTMSFEKMLSKLKSDGKI